MPKQLCEHISVNRKVQWRSRWFVALVLAGGVLAAAADTTNEVTTSNAVAEAASPAPVTETQPAESPGAALAQGFDEASFRIVSERNIFNAKRSGEVKRSSPSHRSQVESFALVGTMAYDKGAFAFFEGSSSELTKVLKPEGIIAGHKLVDIYANGVKLQHDGKDIELEVGWQLRREDQGAWKVSESVSGSGGGYAASSGGYSSGSNGDSSSRSSRYDRSRSSSSSGNDYRNGDSRSRRSSDNRSNGGSDRRENNNSESAAPKPPTPTGPVEDPALVLKRLQEQREKE